MDSIPLDVARKLLNRDFANLVKRVQAGGKISRTERAMLQSMAAPSPRDEAEGFVMLIGGEAVLRGRGREKCVAGVRRVNSPSHARVCSEVFSFGTRRLFRPSPA